MTYPNTLGYEGPVPTRDQAPYFVGPYRTIKAFWACWDALEPADRTGLTATRLFQALRIPVDIRDLLWVEASHVR